MFKSLNRDKCLNDRAVSRQEAGDTSCSGLVRRSSHDGEPRERGVGGAEEGGEDVVRSRREGGGKGGGVVAERTRTANISCLRNSDSSSQDHVSACCGTQDILDRLALFSPFFVFFFQYGSGQTCYVRDFILYLKWPCFNWSDFHLDLASAVLILRTCSVS